MDDAMLNRRYCRLLGAVALLASVLTGFDVAAACTLRMGWEPYAIYTFADQDGNPSGVDIELIKAVAKDVGCEVTFRQLPWARMVLELENGVIDATSSTSRTPERELFAYFSEPYREAEMAVFVRRGEAGNYVLEDLSSIPGTGFRLGVISAYYYGPEFAELMKDPRFAAQVDGAADYETNIRKLLHGRIDGLLVDDAGVALGEAKSLGVEDRIERHPVRIAGDNLHFMFSRKSVDPATFAAINASLAKMIADGRVNEIMARYLE
jgi:polar amino acid transport system substrate-binding protein